MSFRPLHEKDAQTVLLTAKKPYSHTTHAKAERKKSGVSLKSFGSAVIAGGYMQHEPSERVGKRRASQHLEGLFLELWIFFRLMGKAEKSMS